MLERLEEYRRDLEQELADVSDLISRLQAGQTEAASRRPRDGPRLRGDSPGRSPP